MEGIRKLLSSSSLPKLRKVKETIVTLQSGKRERHSTRDDGTIEVTSIDSTPTCLDCHQLLSLCSCGSAKSSDQGNKLENVRNLTWNGQFSFCVQEIQNKGRCIVATEDVMVGQLLIRENPFIWVPRRAYRSKFCHNCLQVRRGLGSIIQSPTDSFSLIFCSEPCKVSHEIVNRACILCFSKCDSISQKYSADADLLFGIVKFLVTYLHFRLDSSETPNNLTPRLIKCVYNSTIQDTFRLESNIHSFPTEWRASLTNSIAEILAYIDWNLLVGTHHDIRRGLEDILLSFACIINSNAHSLVLMLQDNDDDDASNNIELDGKMAYGLFPMLSMFNHSCASNCCYVTDEDGAMSIRAVRRISVGEELCIQYLPVFNPRRIRQRLMMSSRYFTCSCCRCTNYDFERNFSGIRCIHSISPCNSTATTLSRSCANGMHYMKLIDEEVNDELLARNRRHSVRSLEIIKTPNCLPRDALSMIRALLTEDKSSDNLEYYDRHFTVNSLSGSVVLSSSSPSQGVPESKFIETGENRLPWLKQGAEESPQAKHKFHRRRSSDCISEKATLSLSSKSTAVDTQIPKSSEPGIRVESTAMMRKTLMTWIGEEPGVTTNCDHCNASLQDASSSLKVIMQLEGQIIEMEDSSKVGKGPSRPIPRPHSVKTDSDDSNKKQGLESSSSNSGQSNTDNLPSFIASSTSIQADVTELKPDKLPKIGRRKVKWADDTDVKSPNPAVVMVDEKSVDCLLAACADNNLQANANLSNDDPTSNARKLRFSDKVLVVDSNDSIRNENRSDGASDQTTHSLTTVFTIAPRENENLALLQNLVTEASMLLHPHHFLLYRANRLVFYELAKFTFDVAPDTSSQSTSTLTTQQYPVAARILECLRHGLAAANALTSSAMPAHSIEAAGLLSVLAETCVRSYRRLFNNEGNARFGSRASLNSLQKMATSAVFVSKILSGDEETTMNGIDSLLWLAQYEGELMLNIAEDTLRVCIRHLEVCFGSLHQLCRLHKERFERIHVTRVRLQHKTAASHPQSNDSIVPIQLVSSPRAIDTTEASQGLARRDSLSPRQKMLQRSMSSDA